MNIHEYQAKQLFLKHGIPVSQGVLATSPIEAEFAMRRLDSAVAVVKAQIHAGGRGKGGGVKLVKSPDECRSVAEKILGMTLVTKQTGPEGKLVRKVYVEEGTDIAKEYYLAMMIDRETATIAIMFSLAGGMDIEEVAEKTPEKIKTIHVDPTLNVRPYNLRNLTYGLGLPENEMKQIQKTTASLFHLFMQYDCSMIEINPLVVTKDNRVLCLDAKVGFDDNALYRHPEIEELRDFYEEDVREIEASKYGLSYIGLQGNIGCMVNGAGLAMATMDIIKHFGGEPANFLDVGGGATQETVTNAFRLLLSDKQVKAVFVNIFGGIMQCDVIANGVVAAAKELGLKVPLIVRLEGTNVKEGKLILAQSGLKIITADDMADGAKKAVQALK